MKRYSLLILLFSLTFSICFISPPLLSQQFSAYPLMRIGDILDMLTPLILIPLYWLLFRLDIAESPSLAYVLIFLLFVAFWVEGQGIHLSANSIGHLLKGADGSNAYRLTYFYDEVLSHYMWHFGIFGLSALILIRQLRSPSEDQGISWFVILAGIIHGITVFIIVIEATTAPMGIPYATLVTFLGLIWGRERFRYEPFLLFYFVTCLVATLFFIGWASYWGGLPEFSEIGIID